MTRRPRSTADGAVTTGVPPGRAGGEGACTPSPPPPPTRRSSPFPTTNEARGPFTLVLDGNRFRTEIVHQLSPGELAEITAWNDRVVRPLTVCCGGGTPSAVVWDGERCTLVTSPAGHRHDIAPPPAWLMRHADRVAA